MRTGHRGFVIGTPDPDELDEPDCATTESREELGQRNPRGIVVVPPF